MGYVLLFFMSTTSSRGNPPAKKIFLVKKETIVQNPNLVLTRSPKYVVYGLWLKTVFIFNFYFVKRKCLKSRKNYHFMVKNQDLFLYYLLRFLKSKYKLLCRMFLCNEETNCRITWWLLLWVLNLSTWAPLFLLYCCWMFFHEGNESLTWTGGSLRGGRNLFL